MTTTLVPKNRNRRDRRAQASTKVQRGLTKMGLLEIAEIRDRTEIEALGHRWARVHGARNRLLLVIEKAEGGFGAMLLTAAFVREYDKKTGQSHALRLECRTAADALFVIIEDTEGDDIDSYDLAVAPAGEGGG